MRSRYTAFTTQDLGTQEWDLTVESCEGDLDFERLAPVRCNATGADGEPVTMWALRGTLFGQEPRAGRQRRTGHRRLRQHRQR